MSCPYCKKKDCIPEVAYLNAESYGSKSFIVKCESCRKPVDVHISRLVKTDWIKKTNRKDTDW